MLRGSGCLPPGSLPLPTGPLNPPSHFFDLYLYRREPVRRLAPGADGIDRLASSGAEDAGGDLADVEVFCDFSRLAFLSTTQYRSRFSTIRSTSGTTCISAGATAK